jgi:hypothetical protein
MLVFKRNNNPYYFRPLEGPAGRRPPVHRRQPSAHLVSSASASLAILAHLQLQSSRRRKLLQSASSRLPLPRLPPRRLRLSPGSPMASTLAILRPSAPTPVAGCARATAPATARVAPPSRSRFSSSRVSVGAEVTAGTDALFADYKPTTAFLFPGQVRRGRASYSSTFWAVCTRL